MTRLALTGVRLLDGINPAVDGATVVIDGDRIAQVSSGSPPEDVDTAIDLAGRTVMPGMFTCHFHSTYHELGSKANTPYGDEYPPSYLASIAAKNLKAALDCGFTGVFGAGGSHHVEGGVRQAINDGLSRASVLVVIPGAVDHGAQQRRRAVVLGHAGFWGGAPLRWCRWVPSRRSRGNQAGRPGDQVIRDRGARYDCAEGPYRNDARRAGRGN